MFNDNKYGAHEHHTDIKSGLISKDKDFYTFEKKYDEVAGKSIKKKENKAPHSFSHKTSDNHSQFINENKHSDISESADYANKSVGEKTSKFPEKNIRVRKDSPVSYTGKKFRQATKIISGTAAAIISEKSLLSNDNDTGETTVNNLNRTVSFLENRVDKIATKHKNAKKAPTVINNVKSQGGKQKSRYFKESSKVSDSITVSGKSRFVKVASTSKKIAKKGVTTVKDLSVNTLLRVSQQDDMAGQYLNKSYQVIRHSTKAAKYTAKTAKKTVKATTKVANKTYKAAKKIAKSTVKATKAAARTAQAAVRIAAKAISMIVSNPIALIVAGCVILLILIIFIMMSAFGGVGSTNSYEGQGQAETTSSGTTVVKINEYSEVYDYCNKAITKKWKELLDLDTSWTGFLKYSYKYSAEQEDGTYVEFTNFPAADVTPIMAYLSVTYQTYKLSDVQSDIDNIVNALYTFDYVRSPYTTEEHTSSGVYEVTGEQITFFVKYKNPKLYFQSSGKIPDEKLAMYSSILQYGDRGYFRSYNIFGDENWHDYIISNYGYKLTGNYNYSTKRTDFELSEKKFTHLSNKDKSGNTVSDIYSPITGTVVDIYSDSDYDKIIKIKDNEMDIEFTLYDCSVSAEKALNCLVSKGQTVNAGDRIATFSYYIDISFKNNGEDINPLLLMEYYPHGY